MAAILAGAANAQGWPHVGGDTGGRKSSTADQITPANVARLVRAWSYSTGDASSSQKRRLKWKFQATPILVANQLIFCTPFNDVISLDPGTGRQLWRYRHKLRDIEPAGNGYACRGLAYWRDTQAWADNSPCRERILMGTNDLKLVAIDARTGRTCRSFGREGIVTIDPGKPLIYPGEVQITSPPVIAKETVIVGSAIGDGMRQTAPSGAVRAFDVRTGARRWTFDPVPRDQSDPARASWHGQSAEIAGQANVWSLMSVDPARGLVFLPTSSPSVDHYGGLRPGDNRYANSVVALDAATGKVQWHFQTVHHDLWDYDVSAQPILATIRLGGQARDVVIQPTKMGLTFTLDRDTGQPVFPVEERAVPKGDVPGEWYSPTQPFPTFPEALVPFGLTPEDAWGVTPIDRAACRRQIQEHRYEGLFTPPSIEGSILFPFVSGGVNWGGGSFDERSQILFVNTNNAAGFVRLVPRSQRPGIKPMDVFDREPAFQGGTPYLLERDLLASPFGAPCNSPPFGKLHAVDYKTGRILWERPLGTLEDFVPFGDLFLPEGTGTIGGPITTNGGVLFIGAAMDNYLRAFDMADGRELWRGRLPAGGQANPMTYVWKGRQYVVIAAGGHSFIGTTSGDELVAFALDTESPGWWLSAKAIASRPTVRWFVMIFMLGLGTILLVRRWRIRANAN
ncbi:pyrroloquinoline quinone-dependent dehydrogenase [Altererythrobacter litoralis]|uniref:Pyrroloquinoline quinone-dependent dehydrogenase n=1 Tax=Altererythrobacter litoralis TaxID=3113904 RepID=A0ABU7GEK8_9SPHN|nr:pyrroloquinoline quinone-dependent dehydrogenase [Erythrobacteraceae bacterium 1XM1-14]